MANVLMKAKNIPPFEFYINNHLNGKFKHTYDKSTEYYLNFPDDYFWSIGSGELMTHDEMDDCKVNIYRLKSDKDFDIASENMLNSEWVYTNYKQIPTVKKGSVVRDVYVLHYRFFNEIYLSSNSKPTIDNLFNAAIRFDENPHINNWLIYCESDQKWYDFNTKLPNQKNEVIGWVKSPYKLDINEIVISD